MQQQIIINFKPRQSAISKRNEIRETMENITRAGMIAGLGSAVVTCYRENPNSAAMDKIPSKLLSQLDSIIVFFNLE